MPPIRARLEMLAVVRRIKKEKADMVKNQILTVLEYMLI